MATLYQRLADGVVLLHLAFVMFVVGGGLLVLRWPRLAWLHLPAAFWGAFVEFSGWLCPLTPVENWLRRQAGGASYHSDFIEHYILPLLYPGSLTRGMQLVLGTLVVLINLGLYGWMWRRLQGHRGIRDWT